MIEQLKLTSNSKTKFSPNQKNTFGLNFGLPVNGGTCPGATLGPGGCLNTIDGRVRPTCYMAKITQIYKAVGNVLSHNTELLKDKSIDEMVIILRNTVQGFVNKSCEKERYFRLHYSGDFFSEAYAQAWARVIQEFPKVKFWVYTRSFNVVKYIIDCTNLTVMLSVDPVNEKEGFALYELYKNRANLGLAWLGDKKPTTQEWVACPAISGAMKSTDDYGACSRCRLCIDRYNVKVRNITFQIH